MSKQDDKRRRAKYTLEFKLEAVRLVKGGQDAAVTARVLGIPKATLGNWIRAAEKGELQGAGDRPVSAEQMELARLRAELARVKMPWWPPKLPHLWPPQIPPPHRRSDEALKPAYLGRWRGPGKT